MTTDQPALQAVSAAEWLESEPPEPDQIFVDTLDAGDKMAVLAPSKMRKSFFVQQMALALAAGRDFLAWKVRQPRRVVYVQFEIRAHHSHRRTRRLAHSLGIGPDDIEDRLMIISGRGAGLRGADGLERIVKTAADFEPEVIMFDPLYKIAEGAENVAEDFKVLLNAFDQLAERTGAAIVYVHHDTKGVAGARFGIRHRSYPS
jgi:RecA-family ATPase